MNVRHEWHPEVRAGMPHVGQRFGAYWHNMQMEYDEDDDGDPVLADTDPLQEAMDDLVEWVGELPPTPAGYQLMASFSVGFIDPDELDDKPRSPPWSTESTRARKAARKNRLTGSTHRCRHTP